MPTARDLARRWRERQQAQEELWAWGYRAVAGVDEVGRGAWAGPVAAGAVVLGPEAIILGLDDSKRLPPQVRERLAEEVQRRARAWAVGYADPWEIEELGIVAATRLAMRRALRALPVAVDHVLVDGGPVPGLPVPQWALWHGDARANVISAAAVVAKVARDRLMAELAERYPGYGWESNRGYGTADHRLALARLGLSPLHRPSFCRSAVGGA